MKYNEVKKKKNIPPINKSSGFTIPESPTGKRHKPLLIGNLRVIR